MKDGQLISVIQKQSTLVIWSSVTVFSTVVAVVDGISLTSKHYINFVLLGLACLGQFAKNPVRYLITGLLLVVGVFLNAAFTPSIYSLNIGVVSLSISFLFLLFYFFVVNYKSVSDWAVYLLAKE
jgi:hypothetical protein